MTREAMVLEVKGSRSLVCPVDTSECDSCEARHACLALSGGRREARAFWVENTAGAGPGDRVGLELKPSVSLTIIAVTFLVPVLMLFVGYLFMLGGSDGQRAMGAGAGLAVGIVTALIINRRMGSRKNFSMQMTRILERAGSSGVPKDNESGSEGSAK